MKHMQAITPKNATIFCLFQRLSKTLKVLVIQCPFIIIFIKSLLTLKCNICFYLFLQAANDNDIYESQIDSVCKSDSNQISPVVKMRWKQLARNAFNHSVDQKIKQQANNNSPSNCNSVKNQSKPLGLNGNGFLNKNNLIDLFTLNTPSSEDLLICERINNWVQLSGHEDAFALAGPGTIWKKRSSDSTEVQVYESLMNEPISEMIPKFYRDVHFKGENFIELEDLLYHYKDASIMDIKMGRRTFLEMEVISNKARHDLYDKMVKIDPHEPTKEEHQTKAVSKLRYMQFREDLSSSSNLGFRIEGFKVSVLVFMLPAYTNQLSCLYHRLART